MKKFLLWPDFPSGKLPDNFLKLPWFTKKWFDDLRRNASPLLVAWIDNPKRKQGKTPPAKVEKAWNEYFRQNPPLTMKVVIEKQLRNSLPPIKIPKICYESQKNALHKLIMKAWGYKCGGRGDAHFGDIAHDAEQMFLSEAEATGTVFSTHALPFIRSLWETDSPYRDEKRLNRFLIKLGKKLEATDKRTSLPDWLNKVDQTERFIVDGWCNRIVVDGEKWPPLCCLTTPALAKFLTLCKPQRWNRNNNPRTLERAIQRLGLERIRRGKITDTKKNQDEQFLFAL